MQQLKHEAQVVAEHKVVEHVDDVVAVVPVLRPQQLQHLDFGLALLEKAPLVADDLDGHVRPCLVVVRLDHVAKRALA